MDANREDLLRRVDSWGDGPSDPLLSEHTRLAITDGAADIYEVDGLQAIVTLAPTANTGVGLVEIAGKTPEEGARLWDSIREQFSRNASAAGYSMAELVDRGSILGPVEAPVVRSITRLIVRRPQVGSEISSGAYADSDAPLMLEILNEAFQGHPENGNWTLLDIRRRTENSDFDPDRLLVRKVGDDVAGFCWTKVHPDGVGEIYLLAIAKAWRQAGLGKELLEEGLSHLVTHDGCDEVVVYTESDNKGAVNLYESVGFQVDRVDRRFELGL